MKYYVYIVTISYYIWCVSCIECDNLVEIPNGKLCGESRGNVIAFEGIPYAQPPNGSNRFEPPQPFEDKWLGVRSAKSPGSKCLQWNHFISGENKVEGSEDCLFINVYTPTVESSTNFPVIILIQSGAFMYGSSEEFGPHNLLKYTKFVLVTFNYRVGVFGFLSTEDNEISGNFGLKDQLLAINWVKNIIKTFNGDVEKIILAGPSAGGASVHLHILSNKLDKIKVAVSHSGSALNPWAIMRHPLQRTKTLAAHLMCPTHCTKKLKECLKKTNADDIVKATKLFQPFLYNPFTVFGPTIENSSNENAFLTEEPEDILKKGNFLKIPWLLSFVENEGSYNAAELLDITDNFDPMQELNANWTDYLPLMLFYNETTRLSQKNQLSLEIKQHYLHNKDFSPENYAEIQKMFSDRLFMYGFQKSLELHAKFAPVYSYFYKYPSKNNFGNVLSNRDDISFGASHMDDVLLIFTAELLNESLSSEQLIIQEKLVKLYETFIQDGKPSYGDIVMEECLGKTGQLKLLEIKNGEDASISSFQNLSDVEFWNSVSQEEDF